LKTLVSPFFVLSFLKNKPREVSFLATNKKYLTIFEDIIWKEIAPGFVISLNVKDQELNIQARRLSLLFSL